jgi:hypothetical protein
MTDPSMLTTNNTPDRMHKVYGYIHIWSSTGEIRVQCTDPQTIRVLTRAIKKTFRDIKPETREDLTGQVYVVKFTGLEPEEQFQKLGWWLFKMLCSQGWEPMETGEHLYKMKRST